MVDIDDHGIVRGVKILDFGLGQQIRESVARATGNAEEKISHDYFSPEQWRGIKPTTASDQYTLAVLAYEMLSGRRPFKGDDPEALKKAVLEGVPKEIKGVPRFMNAALLKALSTKPSDRYASCSEFARAFAGEKVSDSGSGFKLNSGTVKWIAGAVAAAVAVVAIVAVVLSMIGKDLDQKAKEARKPAEKSNVLEITAAKEAEAKEAARKNISDEAPKSAEIQLTPEQAKQKQETLLLRSSLIRMKKTLDGQKLNRSQTFGTHLDAFADQINAGDTAIEDNDFSVATLCFEAAKKEYDWLQAAAGPRQDAMAKLVAAEENIKKAEQVNAAKFVFEAFNKAKKDLEDGRKAYEAGDFAKALGLFEGAATASETVFTEARSARLKELVMEAKKAEAAGTENDWKKVLNLVKDMKPLDAAVAEEWLAKADAKLPSTMTIVAIVDGREVAASIDGTDVMTPWKSPVLKTGSSEGLVRHACHRCDEDRMIECQFSEVHLLSVLREKGLIKCLQLRKKFFFFALQGADLQFGLDLVVAEVRFVRNDLKPKRTVTGKDHQEGRADAVGHDHRDVVQFLPDSLRQTGKLRVEVVFELLGARAA